MPGNRGKRAPAAETQTETDAERRQVADGTRMVWEMSGGSFSGRLYHAEGSEGAG